MTAEMARGLLTEFLKEGGADGRTMDAVAMAAEALKAQEEYLDVLDDYNRQAKLLKNMILTYATEKPPVSSGGRLKCPSCGEGLSGWHRHCPGCGQKIGYGRYPGRRKAGGR